MKYAYLILVALVIIRFESFGQCYPDRHSTSWYDGWVSCEAFPNPNSQRGLSHWIMYDLGQTYILNKSHIWNTNDPANLDRGLRNVTLDYSLDGLRWTEYGTFVFSQANGSSTYEGFEGPDLAGIKARYVLLTAEDNYGGACYGLSEIRFEAEDAALTDVNDLISETQCFSVQTYPNPFVTKSKLMIQSHCEKAINYRISDLLGRIISSGVLGRSGFHTLEIDGRNLPTGNYIVSLNQGGQFIQQHLIKID